jgi:hypothetical protein
MKGKNWDKPLKGPRFYASELNDHHGMELSDTDWINLVNCEDADFEEKYLEYCKLASSPLGKVLT